MSASSARPGRPAGVEDPPEFAAWRALGMLVQLGVTDQAKLAPAPASTINFDDFLNSGPSSAPSSAAAGTPAR